MKAERREKVYGPLTMQNYPTTDGTRVYITHSPLQLTSEWCNTILTHNIKSYEWIENANLYSALEMLFMIHTP